MGLREKKETWPAIAHAGLHENEKKKACWVSGQLWPLGLVRSWLDWAYFGSKREGLTGHAWAYKKTKNRNNY